MEPVASGSGISSDKRGQSRKQPAGKIHAASKRKSLRSVTSKNNRFKRERSIFVPLTSETVKYNGSYFTVGDIVSLIDYEDNVYYAQIRGLLEDQYFEKSAIITWLIPTTISPKGRFDPHTYVLGYEEEIPRLLDCLEVVCPSPSDYFRCRDPLVPRLPEKPILGFAHTRKGFEVVKLSEASRWSEEKFSTDIKE